MKIGVDIRSAEGARAGKGVYTFNLLRALLHIDRENEYVLYSRTKIAGFSQFKNVSQKMISAPGFLWHHKAIKDIKRRKVDLFWAPSSYIIPALLPKSIHSIITVHDLVSFLFANSHNKKATIIEKIFLKRAAKKANTILTVSENTKEDLIEILDIDHQKIHTVYCASSERFPSLTSEEAQKFKQKTNLPKNFFLAVGTLEPRKNYISLIHAFREIHRKNPHYHLIIVGGEGWDYQAVYDLVQEYSLKKYVHFLGYLSSKSLNGLYRSAKALVFPSYYEGFGIPPLEAMSCGCPVITSNVASIPEVTGKAALYINPEKWAEIRLAMQKLINNPQLCNDLSKAGLAQSQKFSWEKSAKELHKLIDG